MTDLDASEKMTARALDVAEAAGDTDLQLVALAQLGHIRVGKGDASGGFRFLDEAMAAALAGERSTLDTVVYTCCDMLNACELADDLERAAQWCMVADDFVARYGCPFLYAECRIYYGGVLTASGRWQDAERELLAGLRVTAGACPGLHAKALTRLAALRIRQSRLEEADQLLARRATSSRECPPQPGAVPYRRLRPDCRQRLVLADWCPVSDLLQRDHWIWPIASVVLFLVAIAGVVSEAGPAASSQLCLLESRCSREFAKRTCRDCSPRSPAS